MLKSENSFGWLQKVRTRVDESQLASYQEAYARKTSATRNARYARGMGQARQNGGALDSEMHDTPSDLGETPGSEGRSGLPGSGDRVSGGGNAPTELSESGSPEREAYARKKSTTVGRASSGGGEVSTTQASGNPAMPKANS